MRTWQLAAVSAFVVAAHISSSTRGQTPTYRIERVASGLRQPVYMSQAPGDPANIIYYMSRVTTGGANAGSGTHGSLWRYDMDSRVSTEVLNLSHRNLTLDLGPQGFTFHPDFNTPGSAGHQKIYVSSAATGGPVNFVEEYATSGPNGTVPVNGGTGQPIVNRLLMQYTNVFADNNHVIDWIGFDPTAPVGSPERNYLYVSAGDGSNGRPAQERPEQKPNILQGKLLRIDVDPTKPDAYPADPLKNFAIPTTNPIPLWNATHGPNDQLVGTTLNYTSPTESISYSPALPEVYFTGTRNTFRMSLDRATGDFWSGDVGENSREEINFLPADPYDGSQVPVDFGYPQREGTVNVISRSAGNTDIRWNLSGGGTVIADSVNPIQEGPHGTFNSGSLAGDIEIRSTPRSAYIGGYMYRGPVAELQGKYFYSDFVQGNIFSLDFDTNTPVEEFSGTNLNQVEVQPGVFAASLGTREVVLNRNLNSLWHTLMVDPQDPTYTPALGASFGIGRVVSFGEDNAGNLYIVDMGGARGNAGFGNDYPATATGQIFRVTSLVPQLDVTLTVNRNTGELTLVNSSGSAIDFIGYAITSPKGAIDPSDMIPITGHYDIPIPPGDGSIDNNNSWEITSNTNANFGEESTGDKGTLAAAATISLGDTGAWVQSIYEDWSLQITLANGTTATGAVEFIGNGSQPFDRSDLNFNGMIEPTDWLKFRANYFNEFTGLSVAQSYEFGDLNGDGVNDFADFRLFQSDYIAANGLAAFRALFTVPEPTSGVLLMFGALSLLLRRRLSAKIDEAASRCPQSARRIYMQRAVAVTGMAFVTALHAPTAQASVTHQYTFNDGTAMDSVGNADGILFGNAAASAGQLVLPGGSGNYLGFDPSEITISSYTDLTIEAWFTVDAPQAWARLFDYGDRDGAANQQGYIYYAPQSGLSGNPALARYTTLGNQTNATHTSPQAGQQHHLVFVIDDNLNGGSDQLSVYLNGSLATSSNHSKSLSDIIDTYAYLGKSTFPGDVDPYFDGSIDEFRIHDNAFGLGDVQASFAQGPTRLVRLVVNTVTGQASIVTDSGSPVAFDYYEIRSQANALNTVTWSSLDDQNFDPAGPGVGEGWEEADLSNSSRLAEFFLLDESELTSSSSLDLGRPFNTAVFGPGANGDLTFQFGLEGEDLVNGGVEYFTPSTFADFDVDGDVDGRDFLAWQRGFGQSSGASLSDGDADFDGDVDAVDLGHWQAAYGSSTFMLAANQAVSQSVPEPTIAVLWATGLIVDLAMRRGRLELTK
jgi:hypothetical protein